MSQSALKQQTLKDEENLMSLINFFRWEQTAVRYQKHCLNTFN